MKNTMIFNELKSWPVALALLGTAWNAYGIERFLGAMRATEAQLMANGMSQSQAQLFLSLPGPVNLAFAVGVFGGFAGSLLLAMRHRLSLPVLMLSLLGYLLLFLGDAMHGLLAVIPGQAAVLSLVVLIAIGLSLAAWKAQQKGQLN